MTSSPVPTTTRRAHLARSAPGPRLWVAAAAIALAVTALAATTTPDLAEPGAAGYLVSGVVMTAADVLLALGVLVFVRTDVVPQGRWWAVARYLAVVGSALSVVAELVLRVDFNLGTTAFMIAGPAQALGFVGLGVGVIAGRRWAGWHRFILLTLGLYVPVVLVPAMAASGGESLPALAGFHALVLLVGVAWSQERASGEPALRTPRSSRR